MRLSAILIDDEELARKRMKRLLEKHHNTIRIIDEAENGKEAIRKIEEYKPDLVFLDIQMPGYSGFDVLKHLKFKPFVIFTTAYDNYALNAFEELSIDYLLKPIEQKRLDVSIGKILSIIDRPNQHVNGKIDKLIQHLSQSEKPKRLKIKLGDRLILINVDEIVYFHSEDKHTFLHTYDKEYIYDATLNNLETQLDSDDFIRVHRAYILNIEFIMEIVKWFGGRYKIFLEDKNKTEVVTSRRYSERLKNL